MSKIPPEIESERLRELSTFAIHDRRLDVAFDHLSALVAGICEAPVALLTFVEGDRELFRSRFGLALEQDSRESGFASAAIENPNEVTVVSDASADSRFVANSLVSGGTGVRFYAGAPLLSNGYALGTLAVLDFTPRTLTAVQEQSLRGLAEQAMDLLNLRRSFEQQLEREGFLDDVTGLPNRNALLVHAGKAIAAAGRYKHNVSLCLATIDGLESIRSRFGQSVAEAAQQHFGKILRSTLRHEDTVARVAENQFAVLYPFVASSQARVSLDRFRANLAAGPLPLENGNELLLTGSFGLADWSKGMAPAEVLEAAAATLEHVPPSGAENAAAR